jgi:hypothetical protein
MFFIPGQLIALITFPGVIVHESAHLLFCRLRRVAVLDACFFRFGNPAGYVVHEIPPDFLSSFLISVGPFVVNSVLCVVFCLPAVVPVRIFGIQTPVTFFWLWLGLSIGMHAIPSTADAQVLWDQARERAKDRDLLALVSLPLVGFIWLANLGRVIWLDYLYGIAIGLLLPATILRAIVE